MGRIGGKGLRQAGDFIIQAFHSRAERFIRNGRGQRNHGGAGGMIHHGGFHAGDSFQGFFDGSHHTVTIESFDLSYLSTQSTNGFEVYMGLFGWVKGSASLSEPTRVIRNVRVAGTIDTGNDFVRGPHYYGSICARATGNLKLERCGSALNMRLFGYYANNSSRAKLQAAGGVVGYAAADVQIQRCWNTGSLAAYSNANSGNRFYVGGICGNLYGGLVRLCYNTGNITAQMTQSGYGAFVAGIAASNTTTGKVEGSYNQGKIIAYGAFGVSFALALVYLLRGQSALCGQVLCHFGLVVAKDVVNDLAAVLLVSFLKLKVHLLPVLMLREGAKK